MALIAGDRVRLNYADTYFDGSGSGQTGQLFEGLQAAGGFGDVGAWRFGLGGGTEPRSQCEHGVSLAP